MRTFARVMAAFAVAATSTPALGQDASDDWDFMTDRRTRVTLASASFDSGSSVAIRCTDDSLDVLITGLPTFQGTTRSLIVNRPGERPSRETWTVADTGVAAFSQVPARFARSLRGGGRLEVVAEGEGDTPDRRYVFDLPAESSNIDRTLQACGRPLQDDRDALGGWVLPTSATSVWAVPPRPQYSKQALDAGVVRGFAVLSCVVRPRGQVRDCRVESESPAGYRLGRSAVAAAHNARLAFDPENPDAGAGQTFIFRTEFRIDDTLIATPTPSRMDRNADGSARRPGNDDNERRSPR